MIKKNLSITLEDQKSDFLYKKNKSNLHISFNRIGFIFFVFFFNINDLFNSFNSPWVKK